MDNHQDIDERSLELHLLIAQKIRQNPALFNKARATLARWRGVVCQSSQPYLDEWEALMTEGLEACLSVAVERSQRAAALRQASPFTGILTNQERFAFLKSWKTGHAA
ncbi:MAG: hypothetical protein HQL43_17015 [Alphaproteobacteria bacterium]|nr:hypothetical protein [Alphaproteobacteria bacterium]